jgi:hypothetical protein
MMVKGLTNQVAWIPEEFAICNKYLRIINEDGWQVQVVGKFRRSGDYLESHEREYLNHRKVTDI